MSCEFIDPALLLYEINEYRIERGMRFIVLSDFLTKLSRIHVQDILAGRVEFDLENHEIRRNKVSSSIKSCQEVLFRTHITKNLFKMLINEPATKHIIENGYNLCGITIFTIGMHINVHAIFGETF